MKSLTRTLTFDTRFAHLYRPLVKRLLLVLLGTLVLAAIALVVFDERLVTRMSGMVIQNSSATTAQRLKRMFDTSGNALTIAYQQVGDLSLGPAESEEAWRRRLQPYLEAYGFLDSINVADQRGNEFAILDTDEGMLTRRIDAAQDPDTAIWKRWRGDRLEEQWERESKEPPFERPWFVESKSREAGGRHWTEPYEFLTTEDPGISVATPWGSEADGSLKVMALNLSLVELSEFTTGYRPSENGISLVFDSENRVLGLPADERFDDDRSRIAAALTPAEKLGIPQLEAAMKAWADLDQADDIFPFRSADGQTWWAGFSRIPLDDDQAIWSAILVPRTDVLGNVVRLRNLSLGGISLLGALVAGVLLFTTMRSIRSQMKTAMDRVSQKLGQYHIEEKIGEGGNGTVYRASHAFLRRPTALKLMNPEFARSDEARKRFEHEVRMTSGLSHPNTVAIYDFGRTSDGTLYYAMELLEGSTLERLVSVGGPVPANRVIHFLTQACGSLAEAHGKGLIHRDIKPSNLIVCERGGLLDVVKVVDFGLVKEIAETDGQLTQANVLVGTPFFMAPETISRKGAAGPGSDLYALGAVAYYLLAGRHVFEGESAVQVCASHLHDRPQRPSEKAGFEIPADLEGLVLECLAKDPADRPASAEALRDALEACADAGTWTQEDAREWWRENASVFSGAGPGGDEVPMSGTELLVDLESRLVTRAPPGAD